MGFWTSSDRAEIGFLPALRAGILTAPFCLGFRGVRRLLEVTSEIDRHRAQALGDHPFWYLNNMVVREELQGSGLGTKLLGEQLRIVTKQRPGAVVALATQRIENVSFYRRLGFEVVLDETIGRGDESFRNWIMLHPAAA